MTGSEIPEKNNSTRDNGCKKVALPIPEDLKQAIAEARQEVGLPDDFGTESIINNDYLP